jgi:predicted amidohydrolase YtcJ
MGTLTPGKRADMTVLDRDIFGVDPMEIADTRVEMTIFDGRIVYRSD